ncbi:MAG: ferritin family protein [Deltaproteobacteria bacterium]|nr:MAG: ferritin family protein [Deltaproteobacteria bacterium]
MYDFSADDVFEMAQQMERNGEAFYRKAADSVSDQDNKDLLNRLADMEVNHEKIFRDLRSELSEREKETTVFDPQGEAALYLRALADTRVFFEKEMDVSSLDMIFKAALEAEKDSIVFYLGMKDSVPENLGRGKIEAIIKEEMGHVRLLSNELVKTKRA